MYNTKVSLARHLGHTAPAIKRFLLLVFAMCILLKVVIVQPVLTRPATAWQQRLTSGYDNASVVIKLGFVAVLLGAGSYEFIGTI